MGALEPESIWYTMDLEIRHNSIKIVNGATVKYNLNCEIHTYFVRISQIVMSAHCFNKKTQK